MVNASITVWLLLTQSVTTFVIIKSFMGPAFTVVTIGIAVGWFRLRIRRHGLRLEFAPTLRPVPAV